MQFNSSNAPQDWNFNCHIFSTNHFRFIALDSLCAERCREPINFHIDHFTPPGSFFYFRSPIPGHGSGTRRTNNAFGQPKKKSSFIIKLHHPARTTTTAICAIDTCNHHLRRRGDGALRSSANFIKPSIDESRHEINLSMPSSHAVATPSLGARTHTADAVEKRSLFRTR